MADDKEKTAITADMTVEGPKRITLSFFDLPRELRDLVYDEALLPELATTLGCGLDVRVQHDVCPKFMTISRQFADEYKDRAKKKAKLILSDEGSFYPQMHERVLLPTVAKSIKYVEFCISDWGVDVEGYLKWVTPITQLHHIESFSIKAILSNLSHNYDFQDII